MGVIKKYIFCISFLLTSWTGIAQIAPEIHKINGEKYYLHVVEPGNTLYGISKLYKTTVKMIELHNPVVYKDGLKVNQTLLIPVTKENKKELENIVDQSSDYISHEIQPKETLYSLSKRYNTTLPDLLKANPEVEQNGLKVGSVLLIPVSKVKTEQTKDTAPAGLDTLERHIVQKGETVYGLSKRYNTTEEEILAANHGLPYGLKEGMAIRIPGKVIPLPIEKDSTEVDSTQFPDIVEYKPDSATSARILLLLPFMPSFPDSTNRDDFKVSEVQRVALSFYRGFKFAIDSLADSRNVSIHLQVLNSGKDTAFMQGLIDAGELDSFDVVVGPFFTDQFEQVADYTKQFGIPTICPIPKPSKILFKRPNALKTTPSESMQLDALAQLLSRKYRDSNVVVVNSNKFQDQDNVAFFKARYAVAMNVPDTIVGDIIREVKLWDINKETLSMRFQDSSSYILVVPSSNKVFVTKLLGELYDYQFDGSNETRFRVIGIEDWHKFEQDLDIEHIHALNVSIPMTGYIDYHNYRIRDFIHHYHIEYGYEPDRFSFTGFDLADYLLTQLAFNKFRWFANPESIQFNGLLMNMHFKRVMENSGIENQSVEFFEYENFRLKTFEKWPLQEMK